MRKGRKKKGWNCSSCSGDCIGSRSSGSIGCHCYCKEEVGQEESRGCDVEGSVASERGGDEEGSGSQG